MYEYKKKTQTLVSKDLRSPLAFRHSVGEKIRTPDLLVRSQTLYPAELRPHSFELPQQQNLLYTNTSILSIQFFIFFLFYFLCEVKSLFPL